MKKILIHSLTFPPDTISTGMIVSEIADGLNKELNNIEVLASSPQYNLKSAREFNQNDKNVSVGMFKGIKVNFIESHPRQFSNSSRFFQWLGFNFKAIRFIYKNRKEYKEILIFSYPPTMNLVCIFTSKILRINTIYSLWELYPEIAEKLDEQPNRILKFLFKILDNYSLKNVNKVVVNSEELKKYLIDKRSINENKIYTINHFSPFPKSNFEPNLELEKIFYAGNTGRPQNISAFINFFNKQFPQSWKLDLYGAGQEFEDLSKFSNENININDYLPREDLEEKVKDIPYALICLDYEITIEGFPGKTFDYLNMNKILLNFSNPNSAVSKLIDKYDLGFNIDLNNPEELESTLQQMKNLEKVNQILENVSHFQQNISNKKIVSSKYIDLICSSS
ncbi:MAG: hypothetical protein ACJ0FT_02655 [Candidatus Actinomarina sp.]|mgnify:FL=1|tara:strand:+ start:297 stop:1478 length:1182 start_codon:yes stop_codon:yes gene_type:complete